MTLGLKRGVVQLSDFSTSWEQLFLIEERKLSSCFVGLNIEIQHIGSTSIPRISAKPIIDILLGAIDTFQFNEIEKILLSNQYLKCPIFPKEEILYAKGDNYYRTHYIHIVVKDSPLWYRYIYFRDYLIMNPIIAQDYCNLKKDLAIKYKNDRAVYTEAKNDFIESVLKKIVLDSAKFSVT
jgi:GrpB-like predicted nucleotidyltransferase (UPF0157 family)